MTTFRIFYKAFPRNRCVHIRAPTIDVAQHEFISVYPDRFITSIYQVKPFFRFIYMEKYIYSLEVYKRGSWRPVFYPPQSTQPLESEHLPYVESRAELIASQYRGDKFRIVKHETYLIKSYDN